MPGLKDITGIRFSRLVVLSRSNARGEGPSKWLCKCDCGNTTVARSCHLQAGKRVSCGCSILAGNKVNPMKPTKHGHCVDGKSTRAYRVWSGMLTRCTNPNDSGFKNYGARGVRICERWLSFENFLKDMGEPPERMSIDRIDYSGNYEPNNCRWATTAMQSRNKRNNHYLTFNGVTKPLIDWANEFGMNKSTLQSRIAKSGWSTEKALVTPVNQKVYGAALT